MQDAAGFSAGHESMAVLTHRRGFETSFTSTETILAFSIVSSAFGRCRYSSPSDSPNGAEWVASHFADEKDYRPGSCDP
jgi:hypothetical protein